MSTLRMQTDEVSRVARDLSQAASALDQHAQTLDQSSQVLEGAWRAPGSAQFQDAMRQILAGLRLAAESGQALSQRAEAEVNEWEATASVFGDSVGLGGGLGAYAVGAVVQAPAEQPDGVVDRLRGLWEDKVVDPLERLKDKSIDAVDRQVQARLEEMLKPLEEGSTEKITMELQGEVTAVVGGAPARVEGTHEVTIKRIPPDEHNPNETYEVVIKSFAGGGVGGELPKKLPVEAEASLVGGPTGEMTFAFNPEKPGDMSKMAAVLGGATVAPFLTAHIPGAPVVARGISTAIAKDNITGVSGAYMQKASVSASAQVPQDMSAELSGSGQIGVGRRKDKQGHWENVQTVEVSVKGGAKGNNLGGLPANANTDDSFKVEQFQDTVTDEQRVEVTYTDTVAAGVGGKVPKPNLPQGVEGVDADAQAYTTTTTTYKIEGSAKDLDQALDKNGRLDREALEKLAYDTEVKQAEGAKVAVEVEAKDKGAGAGVGLTGRRETERELP